MLNHSAIPAPLKALNIDAVPYGLRSSFRDWWTAEYPTRPAKSGSSPWRTSTPTAWKQPEPQGACRHAGGQLS